MGSFLASIEMRDGLQVSLLKVQVSLLKVFGFAWGPSSYREVSGRSGAFHLGRAWVKGGGAEVSLLKVSRLLLGAFLALRG